MSYTYFYLVDGKLIMSDKYIEGKCYMSHFDHYTKQQLIFNYFNGERIHLWYVMNCEGELMFTDNHDKKIYKILTFKEHELSPFMEEVFNFISVYKQDMNEENTNLLIDYFNKGMLYCERLSVFNDNLDNSLLSILDKYDFDI